MAIAFIQANNGGTQAGPSAGLAYTSNNTAGNLLVLVCRLTGVASVVGISVTDSKGNSWSIPVATDFSGTNDMIMAYASNCKAGANTVTISLTGSGFIQNIIAEYSGVKLTSPLDKSGVAGGTSTTPTSASVTPTKDGELIIGGMMNANSNTLTIMAGANYTKRNDNGNGAIEDIVQSSAAALTATFTVNTSVIWACGIMTFFAANAQPNSFMLLGVGT